MGLRRRLVNFAAHDKLTGDQNKEALMSLVFWILAEPLSRSKWNIFLNPFNVPSNMNETIWADITLNNRVYLAAGTAIAILWGLLNLQRREKIIG